jgi:hypothetical protein
LSSETPADPDLARLNAAWLVLPTHIRSAILALLDSSGATGKGRVTDAPRSPVSRSSAADSQNYQDEEDAPRGKRG